MNNITCPLNGKIISEFPEIITAEDARKYTGKFNNIPYNTTNAHVAKVLADLIDDAVKLGFKCAEYPGILTEDFKNDLESKKFKVIPIYYIEIDYLMYTQGYYLNKYDKTMIIWGDETSIPALKENEFLSEEERDKEFVKQQAEFSKEKAEKEQKRKIEAEKEQAERKEFREN